jgi:hypothetical protein
MIREVRKRSCEIGVSFVMVICCVGIRCFGVDSISNVVLAAL